MEETQSVSIVWPLPVKGWSKEQKLHVQARPEGGQGPNYKEGEEWGFLA